MIKTIVTAARAEMKAQKIEDNNENLLAMLTGIRDSWVEDSEKSTMKSLFIGAINMKIVQLKIKIAFAR